MGAGRDWRSDGEGEVMSRRIQSLKDIMDRCRIDGDMWIWTGYTSKDGTPRCKVNGIPRTVLRAAYEVKYGLKPGMDRVWSKSRNQLDVNPANAMCGTIGEHNKWMAQGGRMKGPHNQIAAIKARDKIGRMFTPDQVEEIRNSQESERVLAERYGCSKGHIGSIRRGDIYRKLAASNASVFSWRPAA